MSAALRSNQPECKLHPELFMGSVAPAKYVVSRLYASGQKHVFLVCEGCLGTVLDAAKRYKFDVKHKAIPADQGTAGPSVVRQPDAGHPS